MRAYDSGVAVFDKTPGAATAAMEFADRLMYTAKESSKGFTVYLAAAPYPRSAVTMIALPGW